MRLLSRFHRPLLTVIIPTRNRAHLLARCLESLTTQCIERSAYEIIVADNASDDDTPEICKNFASRIPTLKYLRTCKPGLHVGRHAGYTHARGEILVYADDDIEAAPTWLSSLASTFVEEQVGIATGPCLPNFEAPPPTWVNELKRTGFGGWWIGAYSLLDLGNRIQLVPGRVAYGCNFSIRRATVQDLRGFHPDGMPPELIRYRGDGETALSKAVEARGQQIVYSPQAAVRHLVSRSRLTLAYIRQREFLQGISASYAHVRDSARLCRRHQITAATRLAACWLKETAAKGSSRGPSIAMTCATAYWRGYNFHQRAVARDPTLLAWVLRPDYLDDAS
jgi:glucosyl-dolichyl phosphate glucuronosyltransferase